MKQLILILCLHIMIASGFTGCGGAASGGTDLVDIPTPVSHLSISSPDAEGEVRITAPVGFADAGSTVSISTSAASSSLTTRTSFSAHFATVTGTVNSDGSFQLEVAGDIGDTCTITYTDDGSETSGESTVPANQPPLPLALNFFDVDIDPVEDTAWVVGNDGTDGYIYIIDLTDGSIDNEIILTGASGANKIAIDRRTGGASAIDSDSDAIYDIHADLTNYDEVAVSNPDDVVAGEGGNFYMIAQTGDTNFSYYSVAMNMATGYTGVAADGATHVAGLFADADYGATDIFGMVNELSDGSFYVFTFAVTDALAISQSAAVEITGIDTPAGFALFNDGTEALVSDLANDLVLRLDLTTGDITTISVGDAPLGIVINDAEDTAYVVASGDDELELIDLASNTVTDTETTGFTPTALAIGSTSNPVVTVINVDDNTANIFE